MEGGCTWADVDHAGHAFGMMDEGQARVIATYGGNHKRLAAVEKKYDPANFFRVKQNIQPAT